MKKEDPEIKISYMPGLPGTFGVKKGGKCKMMSFLPFFMPASKGAKVALGTA